MSKAKYKNSMRSSNLFQNKHKTQKLESGALAQKKV
jgi:hypothetical protein